MFRLALFDMLQGHNIELWAGVDSRGFLFASGLSQINGGGILMIRKKGKLPPPVCSSVVKTEYSYDSLEIQPNTGENRKSVVLVDDVLATGNTLVTAHNLLNTNGYDVLGVAVLIDLLYLQLSWVFVMISHFLNILGHYFVFFHLQILHSMSKILLV